MTIPVIAKFQKAFVGTTGLMDAVDVDNSDTSQTGVLTGAANLQTALNRLDGTGIGAAIFQFSGPYSATASNIDEWFDGRQQTRLRCISNSGISPVTFTLPGSTALGTAFDQLVTDGLPEVLRFVIEYTGVSSTFLRIEPRPLPSPQIGGTTAVIVRSGISATLEITRTSGTISDYVFQSIGGIGSDAGGALDAIKLTNPAVAVWDASESGSLPSSGVVKGTAYRVVNAPSDGSGRFGEIMQDDDWVVWQGETFTSWSAEPHQWFVLPAHEVHRISVVGNDFLSGVTVTDPVTDRNATIRGADYADTAGQIRMKIYATVADYDPADLNNTGIIDEYTDASNQTGYLAIRLTGTQASLEEVLPTLWVYGEDGSGNFTRILNLARDFNHQGDFGGESDYISNMSLEYTTGDTWRIYVTTDVDRYTIPNLDIFSGNISDALRNQIAGQEPWAPAAAVLFSDSTILNTSMADRVEYSPGYNRGVDWRDMSQTTTINANRYLDGGLTITVNLAAFTLYGFGNTIQKVVGIKLQRNDAQTGEGAMIEMGLSQALIRVDTSNHIQVNTTVGASTATWADIGDESGSLTLGSGSDNFLLFEMVPIEGSTTGEWELIAEFFDGTNYHEANNITFTPTGAANGDNLGFSRSTNQRGQVTQFKAINSPGYLRHSQLDTLLRQHQDDKWDFGFARLFEGAASKGVVIQHLLLQSPDGTNYRLEVQDDGTLKTTEIA